MTKYNNQDSFYKGRQTDQWNGIQSPEGDPYIYGQLINKGIKAIQWGKEVLFNKWCLIDWIVIWKKMNPTSHTKFSLKWITNLIVKPKTTNSRRKHTSKHLQIWSW